MRILKSALTLMIMVALAFCVVMILPGCGDQAAGPVTGDCGDCNESQVLFSFQVVTPDISLEETIGDRVPSDPGEGWSLFPDPLQPPSCDDSFYYTIDEDTHKAKIYGPAGCASSDDMDKMFRFLEAMIYMIEHQPPPC